LLDRRDPLRRGGNLNHDIRAIYDAPEATRLRNRTFRVVRECQRYLDGDVAVATIRPLVGRRERSQASRTSVVVSTS
jgi:hypothetical protein